MTLRRRMTSKRSEAVGQAKLHAQVQVFLEVHFTGGHGRHFAIGLELFGHFGFDADFAAQFGGLITIVGQQESRPRLDVEAGSVTQVCGITDEWVSITAPS